MPTHDNSATRYAADRLTIESIISGPAQVPVGWTPEKHFSPAFAAKVDALSGLPVASSSIQEEEILREGLAVAYAHNPSKLVETFGLGQSNGVNRPISQDIRRFAGEDPSFRPLAIDAYARQLGAGRESAIASWQPLERSLDEHLTETMRETICPAFHAHLKETHHVGYEMAAEARKAYDDYNRRPTRARISQELLLHAEPEVSIPAHVPAALKPAELQFLSVMDEFVMPPAAGEPTIDFKATSTQVGVGGSEAKIPLLRRTMAPLAGLLKSAAAQDTAAQYVLPDGWVSQAEPKASAPAYLGVESSDGSVSLFAVSRVQPSRSAVLEFSPRDAEALAGMLERVALLPSTLSNEEIIEAASKTSGQVSTVNFTAGHHRILTAGEQPHGLDGPGFEAERPEIRPDM